MSDINFNPFPELYTVNLKLRAVSDSDTAVIFALRSNPDTMKYVPRPLITDMQGARDQIAMIRGKIEKNEGINWIITTRDSDVMIGIIGHYRIQPADFRSEVGYMLLPEHSGKGIITEALNKVLQYGFEKMKMHSVEAIIDPGNSASEKVLLKCGFVKEAHLKENIFFDGRFLDSVIYSLLKRNYN